MKSSFAGLLRSAALRLSPRFRLAPIAEIAALDQRNLPDAGRGSGWAGALVPVETGWRRAQLVSAETIGLLESLGHPARAPGRFDARVLARLLLDGVLELDGNGGTLSGPEAHPLCFPATRPAPRGALGRLSLQALQYAAALGTSRPRLLAERLYRYNSQPASPAWRRRIPDRAAAERVLGPGALPRRAPGWTGFTSAEPGAPVWHVWERLGAGPPAPGAPSYKLYLSPELDGVAEASRALRGLPARCAPFALKQGGDLVTLLRSEKLVAYYTRLDQVEAAAERLARALRGMRAQGVPFTVALDASGLLSWGADPGDLAEPPGPLRQSSWRRWVTARLGTALGSALAAGAPVPAWHYAIDRLSLEGVHPRRWTPPAWFWHPGPHGDH